MNIDKNQNYSNLINHISKLKSEKNQLIIAIDGNSGSGKTTLASVLSTHFDCTVFTMDDFFLPASRKTRDRLAEPGGNVDYERFNKLMTSIRKVAKIKFSRFNCKTQSYEKESDIDLHDIIIIEGVYSLHPKLNIEYDIKVFLEIDHALQIKRIEARNGSQMLQKFITEWIPLEDVYFDYYNIKDQCDHIISIDSLNK